MNERTAIHAMGNGSFLLYGKGPDLPTMHPGLYSTPSIAGLFCEESDSVCTRRVPGTNIWQHSLRGKGGRA